MSDIIYEGDYFKLVQVSPGTRALTDLNDNVILEAYDNSPEYPNSRINSAIDKVSRELDELLEALNNQGE